VTDPFSPLFPLNLVEQRGLVRYEWMVYTRVYAEAYFSGCRTLATTSEIRLSRLDTTFVVV
jgi:hypothetical protein